MYDRPDDKIILTNHSRPTGTLTAIDPKSGDIVATVALEDNGPESAAPPPPGAGFGRGPLGPIVAAWFVVIEH